MSDLRLSLSQHYHERTKYTPEGLAQQQRSLDFSQQPAAEKHYKLGTQYSLKPKVETAAAASPAEQSLQRLSQLLYGSYGVTGVIPFPDHPIYLRAAPSAGGLYPAELYVIVRNHAVLPPGLYNYQVKTHSLYHFWSDQVWSGFEAACLWHPALRAVNLALVVTAVFERSAWRYEDRAYRRICLDSGHLLGNIELAASLNDYRTHLIGGFVDDALNQILYLDSDQEGAIAAIALADLLEVEENLPPTATALASATERSYETIAAGELLAACHQASQILTDGTIYGDAVLRAPRRDKYNFPFCQKISTASDPVFWGAGAQGLAQTIQQRRSTRQYTGAAIALNELIALLDFTYQPDHYQEQALDPEPDFFDLSLVETFIVVSDVTGLDAGCYYYAAQAQELRQIRFKQFRRELHHLCLFQDLGRDAAAVVFHTADLLSAVKRYGDRAYRYLHLDAGHLGQRLNLAALRLKLGVSGIAGFFDNQVNEVLGIPPEEAVLYITTIGQPRPPAPT